MRLPILSALWVLVAAASGLAAESGSSPTPSSDLLKALIAGVPFILSPIIAWVLSRSGTSGEETRITYLTKRLDLLNKLHTMQLELKDERLIAMFEAELDRCKRYLAAGHPIGAELARERDELHEQSKLTRFFLTAPPKTPNERVFRGLFYFFLSCFVVGLVLIAIVMKASVQREWSYDFGIAFFYLVLALVCRRMAKSRRNVA